MNDKKFSFIIAVTNEQYYEECVYYIHRLLVPYGYTIHILPIYEAESMCSAYNNAMNSSEAKYKIYLHQDVFIRNEKFLIDILSIFQEDESIGMIGMLGGNNMPKTGMTFCEWDEGVVHAINPDMAYLMYGSDSMDGNIQVEAVDGLLIATQYDIPWREDLFKDFDFYDVSQAFEMRRSGYKVIVPCQQTPWTIHDSGFIKLKKYNKNRQICLKEYSEFFYADNGKQYVFDREWNQLCKALGEKVVDLINDGEWNQVKEITDIYRGYNAKDTVLEVCGIMSDIYQTEYEYNKKSEFYREGMSYQEMYSKYTRLRFLIHRMEVGMPQCEYNELLEDIKEYKISCKSIVILVIHSVLYKRDVIAKLIDYYNQIKFDEDVEYLRKVFLLVKDSPIAAAYTFNK